MVVLCALHTQCVKIYSGCAFWLYHSCKWPPLATNFLALWVWELFGMTNEICSAHLFCFSHFFLSPFLLSPIIWKKNGIVWWWFYAPVIHIGGKKKKWSFKSFFDSLWFYCSIPPAYSSALSKKQPDHYKIKIVIDGREVFVWFEVQISTYYSYSLILRDFFLLNFQTNFN